MMPYRNILYRSLTFASIAAILLLLVPSPYPAEAARDCAASGSYNFAGIDRKPKPIWGVRVEELNVKDSPLCFGSANTNYSVWVMIAAHSSLGGDGYAQIGYLRGRVDDNPKYFAEYDRCGSACAFKQQPGAAASGVHDFRVNYSFLDDNLKMFRDTIPFLGTPWSPRGEWSDWAPLWEGETHNVGDDMPGLSGSKVTFKYMEVWPCASCTWVGPDTDHTASSGFVRYSATYDKIYTTQIWTNTP
jgi:hypothetical protein